MIRALGIRPVLGGANREEVKETCEELPILHPDAAGIDVGAGELFDAVSADRDHQPVRSFPTFTRDLNAVPRQNSIRMRARDKQKRLLKTVDDL